MKIQKQIFVVDQVANCLSRTSMLQHSVEKQAWVCTRWQGWGAYSSMQGVRYTSLYVARAMNLISRLTTAAGFEEVVHKTIRVVFPLHVAEDLIRMLRDLPTPDASSICRWRLRLDASFMLWQRARHQEPLLQGGLAMFELCGASPQWGQRMVCFRTPRAHNERHR